MPSGWAGTVKLQGGPVDGKTVELPDRRARVAVIPEDGPGDEAAGYAPTKERDGDFYVHRFDGWSKVVLRIPNLPADEEEIVREDGAVFDRIETDA